MSWERLIVRLERSGLIDRGLRPPRPAPGVGFAGALLGGIGAWLAALFLIGAVAILVGPLWSGLHAWPMVAGLVLCGGLAVWWRGPARSHTVFMTQLGLVLGLAGYLLLLTWPQPITAGLHLRMAGFGLLLWLINPEPGHRRAMVVLTALGLLGQGLMLGGLVLALVVMASGAAVLWLNVPRWVGLASRRDLETLAWTLSLGVLLLPWIDPAWPTWIEGGGSGWSDTQVGTLRACAILTGVVLAAVLLVQARRAGMRHALIQLGLGGIAAVVAATWSMPGVVGALLIWLLARGAGRPTLAGLALVALGMHLLVGYYALETSLAHKGLSLLAGGLVLLGGRRLLGRLLRTAAPLLPAIATAGPTQAPPVLPTVPPPPALPVAPAPRRTWIGPSFPWQIVLVGVGAVLLYGSFNLSILARERLLERGTVVRLALAPVDPRAFLLGDYMDLRYVLADQVRAGTPDPGRAPTDGFVIVNLDPRRVARFVREQDAARPVGPGELALKYRWRAGRAVFGTRAFHFQEGHAKPYEAARFGEFRVDAKGTMLLVRMLDGRLDPIRVDAAAVDAAQGAGVPVPAVEAPREDAD